MFTLYILQTIGMYMQQAGDLAAILCCFCVNIVDEIWLDLGTSKYLVGVWKTLCFGLKYSVLCLV